MRIAIISEYNTATTIGGTEYYVEMLLRGLCKRGLSVLFISRGKQQLGIEYSFIAVAESGYEMYLLPADQFDAAEVKQQKVSRTWMQMSPILEKFAPELIHLHTSSTFFNIRHIEQCIQQFPRMLFTSHVPGHFCAKGDMIRNNQQPCDGKIGVQCTICLFSTGLKRGVTNIVNRYSAALLHKINQLNDLEIDIVCTSGWQMQQLIKNGYNTKHLTVIRQAILVSAMDSVQKKSTHSSAVFRVGYLGRLSPEKGSALLLKLLRQFNKRKDIEFVLGIPANSDAHSLQELQLLAKESELSITIDHQVTAETKADFFSRIDLLFIPSFCIETGPIVLLEAVYYGCKVLAPNAGGPLEFAAEYPNHVSCYDWNSSTSAVRELTEKQKENQRIATDMFTHFEAKQTIFIDQHVELYQRKLQP